MIAACRWPWPGAVARSAETRRQSGEEDDDVAEVTVSRALIDRYKRNLKAYCESLKEYCTRRGVSYLFTSTEVGFDQLVLSYLRHRGLIQ